MSQLLAASFGDISLADRDQNLRDYKLTLEYKHLGHHAPGGVYVLPDVDNLRIWHGVIFLKRGPYANGIFHFRINLPARYGDAQVWPSITFTSSVFNPLVHPESGEVDLTLLLPSWDPRSGSCMLTALTHLKKIFYTKDFALERPTNPEAQRLFREDKEAFALKVQQCVQQSLVHRYDREEGSTMRFTEPKPAHAALRDRVLGAHAASEAAGTSSSSASADQSSKQDASVTT